MGIILSELKKLRGRNLLRMQNSTFGLAGIAPDG
jgi:hypothetical protein